jgi:hypothetical protein
MIVLKISYVTQFRQGFNKQNWEQILGVIWSWMWSYSELILKKMGAILRFRIQILEFDFGIENVQAILVSWCCEMMLWD